MVILESPVCASARVMSLCSNALAMRRISDWEAPAAVAAPRDSEAGVAPSVDSLHALAGIKLSRRDGGMPILATLRERDVGAAGLLIAKETGLAHRVVEPRRENALLAQLAPPVSATSTFTG
jgi:hypothetical protein